MRNWILGLGLLIGIGLAPHSAYAQPSISQITDCYNKMMELRKDLIDLGEYSQGVDKTAALGLIDVATEYTTKTDHIRDLLLIITLIKNQDDRNRVTPVVNERMAHIAKGIDFSLKEVNLEISQARGNAIVSMGNQMKTELRKLQKLLSPASTE